MQKMIFVVDDSDTNLAVAKEALQGHYRVMTMPSAARMFAVLERIVPDLILLDILMPEMDGLQAMQLLKANASYASIPVVFLTAQNDNELEAHGFELGAVDFITKPFSVPVLLNRIKTHLDIDALIRERTAQLIRMQNSIVSVLADMVESRDKTTGGHSDRVAAYVRILLEAMLKSGVYAEEIEKWNLDLVVLSTMLHDIGKIATSDLVLNKPSKLTDEEYESMKLHATEGERIIGQIMIQTGEEAYLHNAKLFAVYHHEHWDGGGYPYGLAGTDIPLQGRIMAIADVYDALVSERPYKRALSPSEAERIIVSGSGEHFDPSIVDVFLATKDQFAAARERIGE